MLAKITIETDLLDLLNTPGYLMEVADEKVKSKKLLWSDRLDEILVELRTDGYVVESTNDADAIDARILGIYTLLEALKIVYLQQEVK